MPIPTVNVIEAMRQPEDYDLAELAEELESLAVTLTNWGKYAVAMGEQVTLKPEGAFYFSRVIKKARDEIGRFSELEIKSV